MVGSVSALVITVAVQAFGGGALASTRAAWEEVRSPHISAEDSQLAGVAAISATDVWATGYQNHLIKGIVRSLMEHWDGSSWTKVHVPSAGTNESLEAVGATAADDVWAVGAGFYSGAIAPLIEHWNGNRWSIVAAPKVPKNQSALSGVAAIAPNDAWAVGQLIHEHTRRGTGLAEHWDGSAWSSVPVPPPVKGDDILRSVAAISSDDVWAVGGHGDNHVADTTLTMHWDGTSWTRIASPNVGLDDELVGVAGTSAGDVWAVGSSQHGLHHHSESIVEHWDGTTWQLVSIAKAPHRDAALTAVTTLLGGDVWVVGESGSPPQAFSEHLTGSTWEVVPMQHRTKVTVPNAVAALPDGEVWAVGAKADLGDPLPLIERYS